MNRKCSRIFLITSLLLTISLAAIGCSKKAADSGKDDAASVKVSAVNISSIETDVEYGSKLASSSEVAVISKVSGKIDSIKAEVGSHVKKGDVLATIDAKEIQAQYNQAKGAYDSANANYVRTADSGYIQQLQQAKSSLDSIQLQYDDAKNTLDRVQKEYNIGDASKEELDGAKLKAQSFSNQLNSAKEALTLLQSKSAPQSNAAAAAQVTQAKASLDLAQIQLDNTEITAPVDGVISMKNVDIGNTVSGGTNVFNIIDDSSLVAEINMTDKNIVKMEKGQKIPIKVDALDNKVFEGVVDSISPSANAKTQLYSVKVRVDNKDSEIKADMIARLSFPDEKRNDVLVVPKNAIVIQNGVSYVYTVQDNKVKRVEVETGISDSSQIELKSGVKQGDNVITEGQSFLQEGQKVTFAKN